MQSQVSQLPAGRADPEYIAYGTCLNIHLVGEILRGQSEDSLPRWGLSNLKNFTKGLTLNTCRF
ncbi:hypothetical protein BDZ94DRAFT_1243878 [Collybia nuda]|uniref:Uncharacterized protein n=1 Tax=Collybia nuda TaxID=64659 RepID=A0A9P5YIC8_9AGAR|nr:hypothetical protein BDZ94DRAFT_1243878 [Collybia nuda]